MYRVTMSHTPAQLADDATFPAAVEAWHALAFDVAVSDDGMPDDARQGLIIRLLAQRSPGTVDGGAGFGTFTVVRTMTDYVVTFAHGPAPTSRREIDGLRRMGLLEACDLARQRDGGRVIRVSTLTVSPWRLTFGGGLTRATGADGAVTIRPAYCGGWRAIVARDGGGIYFPTHSRVWP